MLPLAVNADGSCVTIMDQHNVVGRRALYVYAKELDPGTPWLAAEYVPYRDSLSPTSTYFVNAVEMKGPAIPSHDHPYHWHIWRYTYAALSVRQKAVFQGKWERRWEELKAQVGQAWIRYQAGLNIRR
jgi:hypothetical protein